MLTDSRNSMGEYNPELKVYALGDEACKKIWEHICNQGKNNEYIKRLNNKTKFISENKEISKLEKEGYELVD